ncbi:hypothetical protein TNCV_2031781 [Trichonephila clavipes]|nr:hypothetical protein TNCV_2031781 [Trichonephila clavipes]
MLNASYTLMIWSSGQFLKNAGRSIDTKLFAALNTLEDWCDTSNMKNTSNRATKRIRVLQYLAGERWAVVDKPYSKPYHTFIFPLLTYCYEPLVVARENAVDTLEKI